MKDTGSGRIGQAVNLLVSACALLDVDEVEVSELAGLQQVLVRAERVAAAARVRLARRIAEIPQVTRPEVYLAATAGVSSGEARHDLALSAGLGDRPVLAAALLAGTVSLAQTRAITPGISADPGAEAKLVAAAQAGADLADLRRRARQVIADADVDPDATRARHHRDRALRTWIDAEGQFHARINGPATAGADLLAAIKQATDHAFHTARRGGRRDGAHAYAFDGLLATLTGDAAEGDGRGGRDVGDGGEAAESHLSDEVGGEDTTTRSRSRRGGSRGRERKVVGIIDVAALRRGQIKPGDRCELAGIGPVSLSAITDLLGQATVALLFRAGTVDLAVAHLGRSPTAFQRTALEARGYVCAVTGCGHDRNLEIDHTRDWAHVHQTLTADLDWLCYPHHEAKTDGHIRLTGPPGNRTAVPSQSQKLRRGCFVPGRPEDAQSMQRRPPLGRAP